MLRKTIVLLAVLLIPGLARAGTVTYFGTGTASGVATPRAGQPEISLFGTPASLSMSYTYDPVTFAVTTLGLGASIPAGSFGASASESPTIVWNGDTITFRAVSSAPSFPDAVIVALTLQSPSFTAGHLPDSSGDLVGLLGSFHAQVQPSVGGYRNGLGSFDGSVVGVPEPSSLVLLISGIIAVVVYTTRTRTRGEPPSCPDSP